MSSRSKCLGCKEPVRAGRRGGGGWQRGGPRPPGGGAWRCRPAPLRMAARPSQMPPWLPLLQIAEGALRLGTRVDIGGDRVSTKWRHCVPGCVTDRVLSNIKAAVGDSAEDIDGFADLDVSCGPARPELHTPPRGASHMRAAWQHAGAAPPAERACPTPHPPAQEEHKNDVIDLLERELPKKAEKPKPAKKATGGRPVCRAACALQRGQGAAPTTDWRAAAAAPRRRPRRRRAALAPSARPAAKRRARRRRRQRRARKRCARARPDAPAGHVTPPGASLVPLRPALLLRQEAEQDEPLLEEEEAEEEEEEEVVPKKKGGKKGRQ